MSTFPREPEIAVIMPAYNAEKDIERSVRSVLSQTFHNLKLLVIDDGSTDATEAIVRRLAAEDPRLQVLRTENHGPAEARNIALSRLPEDAEYVTFVDADDELLPDALAYALSSAGGADLILFGFTIQELNGRERDYCESDRLISASELKSVFPGLYKANLLNQVWAKLYSAPLLRKAGLRFENVLWGEDRLFVFDFLKHASLVSVCSECKYRYVMHPGDSLISKFYQDKFSVCLEADRRARELIDADDGSGDADLRFMFAKSVFSCITTLFSPSCPLSDSEKKDYIREICSSEQLKQRCRNTSGGAAPNILCAVLQSGNVPLILAVFRAVVFISTRSPDLTMKIKHRK